MSELNDEMLTITLTNGSTLIAHKLVPIKDSINSQIEAYCQIHKQKTDDDKFQQACLKGSLNVALLPRYIQTGVTFIVTKQQQYLVVNISRLNVFDAVNDLGDPTVWATLEWGGISRKSRPVKKP
jgi:hypothetical protein